MATTVPSKRKQSTRRVAEGYRQWNGALPIHLIAKFETLAEAHYRSLVSEVIVAMEEYAAKYPDIEPAGETAGEIPIRESA